MQIFPKKTLHAKVADALRQDIITRYRPGEKLEGEVKLAKRLGVSQITLRQALTFSSVTVRGSQSPNTGLIRRHARHQSSRVLGAFAFHSSVRLYRRKASPSDRGG